MSVATFPYVQINPAFGTAGLSPLVPVTLISQTMTRQELALVDSGAAVNVIPYSLGQQLGANWDQYPGTIPLAGALGQFPAKPLFLEIVVASFPAVRMAFAWSQSPFAKLILGQVNFFLEFDVCFHRTKGVFEIQPATP